MDELDPGQRHDVVVPSPGDPPSRYVGPEGNSALTNWAAGNTASPGLPSGFSSTSLANFALLGFGAATSILAARLLGPSGRGQLTAIWLWPTLLATVAMIGMPEALVFFAASDRQQVGSYLGSSVAVSFLSACAFLTLGFFLMPVLLHAQSARTIHAARVFLLEILLFSLVVLPYHSLRGLGKFGIWNALRLLPSAMWLLVLCGVAGVMGVRSPSVLSYVYLGGLALTAIPVWRAVLKYIPRPYSPSKAKCRPLITYGLPAVGTSLPLLLNLRTDQLVIGAFLGARELGLYATAVGWSILVNPVLQAVGLVLVPHLASQGDEALRYKMFARVLRLTAVTSLSLALSVGAVTPPLFLLVFGSRFRPVASTAVVLVVAASIWGFNWVVEEGLRGLGRPVAPLIGELAGLPFALGSLAFLLPIMGIMGAAIASLIGYSAVTVFLLIQAHRISGMRVASLILPTVNDIRWVVARVPFPARTER